MADELNPFDIESYPEEARELAKQAAERYQAAQAAAAQVEGLGLDGDSLKRAAEMYTAYTDPQRARAYHEAMARQWEVLPEGMTLDELGDIARQVAAARNAPGNDDYYDPGAIMDPQQYFEALKQNIMADIDERLSAREKAEMERAQEADAERKVNELRAQEAALYRDLEKNGRTLDDDERGFLEAAIALRLERDELSPENYQTFVRDTYEQFDRVIGNRAAALMKAQGQAPRTGGKQASEGATPGGKTVVTDFKSAQKMLDEMFPNG